jgi:hypothetical protein
MSLAYEEVIDFIAAGTTPRAVADFQPSAPAKARVAELMAKRKTDGLTEDESAELDNFLQLEHLMRMAKARARTFLPSL